MRILIVGDSFGFPNGGGASARVYAYAKGLMANDVCVRVLCLKTTERKESGILNTESDGSYEEILYTYTCGQTIRAESFWRRRWLEMKGILGFYKILFEKPNKQRYDALILFSNSLVWIIFTVLFCRISGTVCIQEKSEFPFVYHKKTMWVKIYSSLFTRFVYRLSDGMIVISTFLEEYFSKRIRKNARILRVPILVEGTDQRASDEKQNGIIPRRIVYMGNLGHPGEVSSVIEAYVQVAHDYLDWNLQIIGDSPGSDILTRLNDLAVNLRLNSRIEFTGMVKRDDLNHYLKGAGILVLPRSSGLFSQAGFPTKLGEYLATGKPVIVTATGDIPLYLEDMVSAYLVPPDDTASFIKKLRYVMSHPNEANTVGRRGRDVARINFDYRSHCFKMKEFIHSLQDKNRIAKANTL